MRRVNENIDSSFFWVVFRLLLPFDHQLFAQTSIKILYLIPYLGPLVLRTVGEVYRTCTFVVSQYAHLCTLHRGQREMAIRMLASPHLHWASMRFG